MLHFQIFNRDCKSLIVYGLYKKDDPVCTLLIQSLTAFNTPIKNEIQEG
jgi:hypothetical protein